MIVALPSKIAQNRRATGRWTGLFGGDARAFDDCTELHHPVGHHLFERSGRHLFRHDHATILEVGHHGGRHGHLAYGLVQRLHYRIGCARRRGQARPGGEVELGVTHLGHGGHIGQLRQAPVCRHGQGAHLARLDVGQHDDQVVEDELHLVAQHARDQRRAPTVGNVRGKHARGDLEHFHIELAHAAHAAAAVVELAGVLLGVVDELLEGLDEVDWPESTKMMQRNWIGKSKGAQVRFQVKDHNDKSFEVFTTRPDTLFGATFCVLAPEHPLVAQITAKEQLAQVKAYTEAAKNKTDLDRTALDKEKSGIFIGAYAVNPVNKKELPIYIADYVLMDYGLGAIMAVPGHDERDHEFAKKYALPIVQVLKPKDESSIDIQEKAFTGDGILVQSGFLDGLDKAKAIEAMISHLEKENLGKALVTYRLRDWIFSRQRYWGEPFPLAHDKDGKVVGVSASELPVLLPDMQDFKPSETGEPPLSKADNWLSYSKDGKKYLRETNIMPQWAGSCWYYLRYIDPFNTEKPWDPEKEKHWLPVDLYVGGVEHANLHLLYARFWHKVLYRLGYVSTKEPFKRLIHQGLILGPNSEKMSKSRGNVINPDDVIYEWGSDSLRLYEMFMGPIEAVKPWQTQGIAGVHRFLKRAWTLILEAMETSEFQKDEPSREMLVACHKLVKKVSEDTYDWKFNTAISAMMEFINLGYKDKSLNKKTAETFILLLAPYAPHLCEELWQRLGHKQSLAYAPWPSYQESLTVDDNITLSVMVNGKLRGSIEVAKNIEGPEAIRLGKSAAEKYLDGKTLIKEIYVPGKIVNFVVKD